MGRKWQLPRSSKKLICPSCRQRSFKPYVYADSGEPVDETQYGRCDRENNCGYHMQPNQVEPGHGDAKPVYVNQVIFPKDDILTPLKKEPTNLHLALAAKGIPHQHLYDNGVLCDNGLTVYVFRNHEGKLCNTKHFKYKPDGHRQEIAEGLDSFSLKQPKQRNPYIREHYTMPLFGEHELALDPEKKKIVCVVESEKSKVIAMFHYPQFIWLACGSANGLSDGSDGSADKITPLKGRTVYWVCDNDQAARGKFREDDKRKTIWVDCSSVRNGKKLIQNFHIVDLFRDKEPGYDIGDALLDGLKPEIKPTWSKAHTDKRYKSYLPPGDIKVQKSLASQVGEGSGISDEFSNTFSWMRTHVNAFYGWSNDGKGVMLDFLSAVQQKKRGWKRVAFKHEDLGAYFDNGSATITADRMYARMVWTLTGKIPPAFQVYATKHSQAVMTDDEYMASLEFVKKHNFFVNPEDRRYKNIFDELLFFHEVFGADVFEIDPWNTMILEEMARGDERLINAFIVAKEFVLKTNTVLNIVNHAGSKHEVKEKSGAFKVVTQFMQLGGSAWDIKMDGQFSIHRPYRHKDPNDPRVHLYNLKQRESEIVGAERGVYKHIQFDRHKRQYYFRGVNPIDGSTITPIVEPEQPAEVQGAIPYEPSWRKKKGKKEQTFEEHLSETWGGGKGEFPDWVTGQ